VRRRIDAMGIAEPNIYPKNRQIVIELPGLSDTTTEIKAARKDVIVRLRPVLTAAGAGQISVSESAKEPEAFKLTLAGTDAREILARAFPEGLKNDKINDQRLGLELELLPADAGAAVAADVVNLRISEAARDKVLEESSDFRRLLKVIERAAVLEMRMIDDETPFADTGKPYLQAIHEGRPRHLRHGHLRQPDAPPTATRRAPTSRSTTPSTPATGPASSSSSTTCRPPGACRRPTWSRTARRP
jgi:hypothetical protein